MSVLIETSAGSIVVDLFVDKCPTASLNFLKLCKAKYYNNCLLYDVQPEWIQSGDPTGTGSGGASIFALCAEPSQREERRWFSDEIRPDLKLNQRGLLCMSSNGLNQNGSRFFISLNGESVSHLNGKKTVFGQVAEDEENTLDKIASVNVDDRGRPFRDIRILHTFILVDPFPDPEGFMQHPESPKRTRPEQEKVEERIGFDQAIELPPGLSEEEVAKRSRESEMKARAVALEMMGDLPDADAAPPENVLFVCKLNAITQDDDLEIIFSRFGDIKSCEVIRDKDTGQSLQYAFVEFATKEQCQEAYFKMNNVLIDDRRIKVDFSQSVAKTWNRFRRQGARQSASGQTEGFKVGAARSFNNARNRKDWEHRDPGDRSKHCQRDGPGHSKDIRHRDRDQRGDHRRDRSPRFNDRDTHELEKRSHRENRRHDRGNSRERDHRRHRESENSRLRREHRHHRDSSRETSSSKRDRGQNDQTAEYRSDSSLSSAQSYDSRDRSTKKHHKKQHKHRKHRKHHKSSKSSKSSRSYKDDRDRKRSRRD